MKRVGNSRPYIIKWASGDNLVDPKFTGVSVLTDAPTAVKSTDNNVSFNGSFSPAAIAVGDKSCLFIGTSKNDQNEDVSTLYWPDGTNYESFGLVAGEATDPAAPQNNFYLGAFRAYFHVDLAGNGAAVRQFVLNFGDSEATGISEAAPLNDKGQMINDNWYSLDGRKLDGVGAGPVPARLRKGLYIHNGRKVVVK